MQLRYTKKAGVALLFILFTGLTGWSQKVIDKVVAKIGDEIILLSDVQNQRLQQIQEGVDGTKDSDCAILEEFMYEKLLVTQAKIDSLFVADEIVNQEMENRLRYIAEQIGSIEKLEEFYGKSVAQIKADFFELIKKRMLAEQMKAKITENVKITPKEVNNYYKNLPKDSIPYINSKVSVAQIVIYPEITDNDKSAAQNRLQGILDDVSAGKIRFETAATLNSDDPGSKVSGGDLGWQTRGTMVPEFEAALFKLKPSEISPVFETQYGYHIVQLIDRKGDNYHSRHILIMPRVNDMELVKASTRIDSIHKELKKGTITFEEAARRFSNDENSKFNGGKIVNPYSGDYFWDIQNINDIDPQMSRLVDILKPGQYSTPSLYNNLFEQKQGIRIVKLITKTEPHLANLKSDRQLIELSALNKKKQKVIDRWISSKISGNYVEISPEYIKDCDFKYDWIKGS